MINEGKGISDIIKEDILNKVLLQLGSSQDKFKYIKLARKNIEYWKIFKYKTRNFLIVKPYL